ncbi:unnamed protein product [Rotaria sp. Silwood1]|nr:unnamed protein product [Rotaria sp. Silwood1]CAF3360651.1 unnamed protein product [Rotaria sp. Silwood1]CAF3396134.1 unnamed protein product [Rotaria sp. Silwood1]CAF4572586.1 unnamed protein product [Rotaria sp. Silwood1]CAF4599013.1 unnamed protein product [Rotaria sp. Silwood1]
MPIDNWLILALIMIFSSIILCGLLPMIIRLIIARRRYRRYRTEFEEIACSTPDVFSSSQLIYENTQINNNEQNNSHEHSILYSRLPFIDDLIKDEDTFV